MTEPRWRLITASVAGPRKPKNQDHQDQRVLSMGGEELQTLAVADGHGSAPHHLSHIGSRLATESFFEVVEAMSKTGVPREVVRKGVADRDVPRNLVRYWRNKVDVWRVREEGAHSSAGPAVKPDYVPYGTTLLGVMLSHRLMAAWQIGDGEVVVADAHGTVTTPVQVMGGGLGDETDSLCSADAEGTFRSYWRPIENSEDEPSMVLVCTDGLSKSFDSDQSFLEFAHGVYVQLREHGPDVVEQKFEGWLRQASEFSGDDTTAVVAWRMLGRGADDGAN